VNWHGFRPIKHHSSAAQTGPFHRRGGRGGLLALGWNCSQWVKVRIIFSQNTPAVSRSRQPLAIEPGLVGGLGLGEVLGTTKFQ